MYNMYSHSYDIFSKLDDEAGDIIYLRRMYPDMMRQIQSVVDDECDKLEYDGSFLFDEYPDRLMVDNLNSHICKRVYRECYDCDSYGNSDIIRDIVSVILCNEICRRRSRRRNHSFGCTSKFPNESYHPNIIQSNFEF